MSGITGEYFQIRNSNKLRGYFEKIPEGLKHLIYQKPIEYFYLDIGHLSKSHQHLNIHDLIIIYTEPSLNHRDNAYESRKVKKNLEVSFFSQCLPVSFCAASTGRALATTGRSGAHATTTG